MRCSDRIRLVAGLCCALTLLALTPPVFAEDWNESGVLDEIIVTAQRKSEVIADIPIAISAYSGDSLANFGVTNTSDLSNLMPGFTAADSGYNTPVYTLRGIGFNDTTYTATSTVGVYVDEVSLPYSIMTKGANLDLERVEILKGPQGTLYGRNTTGGAINYITNKPSEQFGAGVTASYSSYKTSDVEAFVTGPLGETVKGRVAMHEITSDEGWQESVSRDGDTLGRKDKFSMRTMLDFVPNDSWLVRWTVDHWYDKSDSQAPQAIAMVAQSPYQQTVLDPQVEALRKNIIDPSDDNVRKADWSDLYDWQLNDKYFGTSLRTEWEMNETTSLTILGSFGRVESDGSELSQSGLAVPNAEQKIDAHINTGSLEVRINGELDDGSTWMLGANYSRDSGKEYHLVNTETVSVLNPQLLGFENVADEIGIWGETRAYAKGIFFHGDHPFADDEFRVSTGLRYTEESRDFTGCSELPVESNTLGLLESVFTGNANTRRTAAGLPANANIKKGDCLTLDSLGNNAPFKGSLDESNVSGRVSLDWRPSDGYLFYYAIIRGYKSGGFPVTNSSEQDQYKPVTQEKLTANELGSKLTFLDHKLQINSAIFYYDYRDKQLLTRFLDPTWGPLPILDNAPKSTVKGAEVEVQAAPIAGLYVSLAASYLDTKIDEFVGTDVRGNVVDLSGKPFNFAPKYEYTVLTDYSHKLTDSLDWGVGFDYAYSDETNSSLDEAPLFKHKAFGILNLRARVSDSNGIWDTTLWMKNATDEFSQLSIFQTGDTIARYTGMPRTIGVTVKFAFE